MSRDWKPGDVAMVECSDGAWRRAAFFLSVFDPPAWVFPDNTRRRVEDSNARPLVVIDPEDREQAERLLNRFMQGPKGDYIGGNADDLQDALRSLIAPPKPDEPTGVGAVVEDDKGEQWVRGHASDVAPWLQVWTSGDYEPRWRFWSGVPAVRVLSEGVTP